MSASADVGIVVDTSAAVAIITRERGHDELISSLETATTRLMAAPTRVELGMVLEARLGPAGADVVARFLRDGQVETEGLTPVDADRALSAWRRYGKGRHRAALNFGDCFSYALAERTGMPLLCTGEDFAATDLEIRRPGPPADTGRSAPPPRRHR